MVPMLGGEYKSRLFLKDDFSYNKSRRLNIKKLIKFYINTVDFCK